jgi:2-amino-4-hydroxy-6-hydroxymethyldihydropteridine diphosphokinase
LTSRRVRAYIGLGSNVGDSNATLASAVRSVAELPASSLRGVSRLYATDPVGVTEQPEFRNAAVAVDVPAGRDPATGAMALLTALKALERSYGRRDRGRWGPREIDLDLLVFGRARLAIERTPDARSIDARSIDADTDADPLAAEKLLVVPHASAAERLFVLAPLADLAPRLVPPGWGRSVEGARRQQLAAEGPDAVRVIGIWDANVMDWRPVQPR